ncbi:hypothetical protein M413DRAFT_443383 [Hebeloma cylindrosporum]|uniref:Uncharacterized protein n=1 Tax=Hebeloma cylindrosporum TaxID=76867 RepID=A0A0C3CIK2_HEBCY|nr:hypothetical protein M413DRAFT_443383 [Hebeloma cylindrosporum h7]
MGCVPSKTADVEVDRAKGQARKSRRAQETTGKGHSQHIVNISPSPGGEKTLPTKHVKQRISPAPPPDSAFRTPGRVLGSAPSELSRDAYTGQRIYAPTDPNHPSRRPVSSAFKKRYRRYYDEASPQMPQHLVVRLMNGFISAIGIYDIRDSVGLVLATHSIYLSFPFISPTRSSYIWPNPFYYYSWLIFVYLTWSSCMITLIGLLLLVV